MESGYHEFFFTDMGTQYGIWSFNNKNGFKIWSKSCTCNYFHYNIFFPQIDIINIWSHDE